MCDAGWPTSPCDLCEGCGGQEICPLTSPKGDPE
jgi:hypothetical protein